MISIGDLWLMHAAGCGAQMQHTMIAGAKDSLAFVAYSSVFQGTVH
jgi:hypothetical protein